MKTVFLRALEASDKAEALRSAIHGQDASTNKERFEVDAASFAAVPRSPFTYWISESLRAIFGENRSLRKQYLSVRGAYTTDDFRFYRLTWEVPEALRAHTREETRCGEKFVLLAKGGEFSPFYSDLHLVVRWENDGAEAKAFLSAYREKKGWGTDWSACLNGYEYYFRPGLTWPRRPHKKGWFAHVHPGAIFSDGGPMLFCELADHWALCALLNSEAYITLLHFLMARGTGNSGQTLKYEMGYVTAVPVPPLNDEARLALAELAHSAWRCRRSLYTVIETSQAFVLPALLRVAGDTLAARAAAWAIRVREIEDELSRTQVEIDERCFSLYRINATDRRSISEGFGGNVTEAESRDDVTADLDGVLDNIDADVDADDNYNIENNSDAASLATELVSWTVGAAFGRFDVRLATVASTSPTAPEPFEPLPACSPSMLTGNDGLPLASALAGYPVSFPSNGILVEDSGHARDLTTAVRAVFDEVFIGSADAWWNEVRALLDPQDHDLRAWLISKFFEHHLKSYSKSRRKAPIFWQLAVPSGRYGVWLYAHRLTRDSFFQIQTEVIAPKLAYEERQLTSLMESVGSTPSVKERKEFAARESFVEELRMLLDEVRRIAPLWNPRLDDGMVLTMAPLWRLVPQPKPWQKELKCEWGRLAAGKYDWAHLAMHLWPERVVPKCAADRSLAIVHGLEDVFWLQEYDGKWKPRPTPLHPIDVLVGERTSTAVKAALKGLNEASEPRVAKVKIQRSPS
jgi:hypothetical protein